MIQLFQAVSGEIEYVRYTKEELIEYIKESNISDKPDYWIKQLESNDIRRVKWAEKQFTDFGVKNTYCLDAMKAWQLNKRLRQGKILVGVDGDSFLFAKPENIVKGKE